MARRRRHILITVFAVVALAAAAITVVVVQPWGGSGGDTRSGASVPVPGAIADGIDAMTAVTRKVSAEEQMTALQAARFHAYVAVAMARAALVDSSAGVAFQHRLNGFPTLQNATSDVDPRVAAIVAGATAARGLVALDTSRSQIAATRDDALVALQPSLIAGRFADSLGWGYLVGSAVVAWSQRDGTAAQAARSYTAPAGAGRWRPPAGVLQAALAPYWGSTRPFVTAATSCRDTARPVAFGTAPDGPFARDARALIARAAAPRSVAAGAADQWLDPIDGGVSVGTRWLGAAAQLAHDEHLDPAAATGLYARVALAQADALIAAWDVKYRYDGGRPATAIPDGGVSRAWQPASTPPPSPAFPAETVTLSAAASRMLGAATPLAFPAVDGSSPFVRANAAAIVGHVSDAAVASGEVFPSSIAPSAALGSCVSGAVQQALGAPPR